MVMGWDALLGWVGLISWMFGMDMDGMGRVMDWGVGLGVLQPHWWLGIQVGQPIGDVVLHGVASSLVWLLSRRVSFE